VEVQLAKHPFCTALYHESLFKNTADILSTEKEQFGNTSYNYTLMKHWSSS